jgi:secreted trypsin-like serine protease
LFFVELLQRFATSVGRRRQPLLGLVEEVDMKRIAIFCLCFVLVWATPLQKSLLKEVSVKDIDSRILNGAQAALGQFPWEAALYVNIGTTTYFCSGNIISEEWILTVAQCIIGADSIDVLAGLIDLNGSGTVARGTEIVLHGDYDPDAFNNDIGLIKLSTPITFNGTYEIQCFKQINIYYLL